MKAVLIVDASDPNMLLNAPLYGADAVIFDLTRAEAGERDAARLLLREALLTFPYADIEVFVRINTDDRADAAADAEVIRPLRPDVFVAAAPDGRTICRVTVGEDRDVRLIEYGETVAAVSPASSPAEIAKRAKAAKEAGFAAFATDDAGAIEAILDA
jgi:citrate lyase beta subunit